MVRFHLRPHDSVQEIYKKILHTVSTPSFLNSHKLFLNTCQITNNFLYLILFMTGVAKLADAHVAERVGKSPCWVRIPPSVLLGGTQRIFFFSAYRLVSKHLNFPIPKSNLKHPKPFVLRSGFTYINIYIPSTYMLKLSYPVLPQILVTYYWLLDHSISSGLHATGRSAFG